MVSCLFASASYAADTTCTTLGGACVATCTGSTIAGATDCVGTNAPICCAGVVKLTNPLGNITTPEQLIGTVIKGVLGLIGAVTLAMLVFGGFKWLTSAGNQEQVQSGTQTMLWAVIGLFLVFAAYLLVTTFLTYLTTGTTTTAASPVGCCETDVCEDGVAQNACRNDNGAWSAGACSQNSNCEQSDTSNAPSNP